MIAELDVLIELIVNKNIHIEVKGIISKSIGTSMVTELIGNSSPFKTFDDLEHTFQ